MRNTDLRQLLPTNIYQATVEANMPSAANPFATMADIGGGNAWNQNGNIVGSEKFIGTRDNFALPIRVSNVEVAKFNTSGNFLLGQPTPTGRRLDVFQDNGLWSFGSYVGDIHYAGLYINQTTPAATNYSLIGNGSDLYVRANNTLYLIGGGTNYLTITNSTSTFDTSVYNNTGDYILKDSSKGLVLKDTQGTPHYWRVTITNLGVLQTTDLGTTLP